MDVLEAYVPPDRRWALARGETLPDRAHGAVLFADVSGFTRLTEAITRSLGARRGAEELTRQLNVVYDALIAHIENHAGSVVMFSGDAATAWFAESEEQPAAAQRAVACALALQTAMQKFTVVPLPDGSTMALAIKVTVASGRVRRFVVGDPNIRLIDIVAGDAIARTAAAEHLAHPGEILIDTPTADALGARVEIAEWRNEPRASERFAVLRALREPFAPTPLSAPPRLTEEQLKPWLYSVVYERARAKGEDLLTELRPVVALFARFRGIDFEGDDAAGEKLDQLVSRAQQVLARYDGVLLELTIGDKGSYFYASFGAPHTHEDDARRAVLAARELFPLCVELGFLEPLQVGISQGVMRVGGYGSATRRTYGVQGDEVNLAARLMTEAAPGTLLVSGHVQKVVANEFDLEPLPPIRLKGKAEPLLPFVVQGLRDTRVRQLQEAYYSLPMIGRTREFALIQEKLELARSGAGQVIGITAPAGMGKSRLTAEIIRSVRRRREATYGGECPSFGKNISYLVWMPIWRAFFGIDANLPPRRQLRALENEIKELAPERIEALPLLSAVLGLTLAENDFTRALEPEFRKSALHALLLECVRAAAAEARVQGQLILFVIEDAHWIDPASLELLEQLASSIAMLAVALVLNYRPPESDGERLVQIESLPHFTPITLAELDDAQGEGLIRAKLAQHAPESGEAIPAELIARVNAQAQGNPFYIEQLLDYLHDRGVNVHDAAALSDLDLPNTLHRLILSRLDQLNEQQQLTLKAASVIGRSFTLAHLCGYFPRLGSRAQVQADLVRLEQFDLTSLAQPEPEVAYLFKHVVAHQVAYESLAYATRAALHEAYANFLEMHQDPARVLDLLAYHYDHSKNVLKRREYLRRAGEAAAARFANVEAVDYITRALALEPESKTLERFELLSLRERVLDMQGERERQRADLDALEVIAIGLNDPVKHVGVILKQGWLAERISDHAAAARRAQTATEVLASAGLGAARRDLETEVELLRGVIDWQQGKAASAKPHFERALELARAAGARTQRATALNLLGLVHREMGEYATAQACHMEQHALARSIGDRRREWSALNNLGLIANARGNFADALENYTEALRIVHEIGDRLGEELLLGNLGLAAMNQGEYDRSREYAQQALTLANTIGDQRSVCRVLLNLGETYRLVGDYGVAREKTERALTMARTLGDRLHEAGALMNLGALALDQGAWERAGVLAAEGMSIAREIGYRDGEAFLLNTLGRSQLELGQADAARAAFENALALWLDLEPSPYMLEAYAGLAELALERNDQEQARQHTDAILTFLQEHPERAGDPSALEAAVRCYRVRRALHESDALDLLENTQRAFEARVEKIADADIRRAFVENVRAHQDLARAWAEANHAAHAN